MQEIETELRKLFEKYGAIENIVAKRNRNSEYCFAFVEMKTYASALDCVKKYERIYEATTRRLSSGRR